MLVNFLRPSPRTTWVKKTYVYLDSSNSSWEKKSLVDDDREAAGERFLSKKAFVVGAGKCPPVSAVIVVARLRITEEGINA